LSFTALADEHCRYTRAGYSAQVLKDEQPLGLVGEVAGAVVNQFNLKQPVFLFELDVETLARLLPDATQMAPIPRFPSTARDITVIVDREVESGRLLEKVSQFGETLVEGLHLFDVFTGDPIPQGKKSVSFRVVYRSPDRTLDDETINEIHRNLTHRLITEVGATLPA
jgi:phenylalanyl-tRNA synthetase beta chain